MLAATSLRLPASGTRRRTSGFGPFSSKGIVQKFYDNINLDLNLSDAGDDAYFMNLGYVHDGSPSFSSERLPERTYDRESHQLVLEVLGDCDLAGKAVVEIGCGRGGAAYVLQKHCRPDRYLGIDLSEQAVAFCRRVHQCEGYAFIVGDAESPTVPHGSFDVLLNIESSHNYPNICTFYLQANRALKSGGYFLYADSMQAGSVGPNVERLRQAGFEVMRQIDITANVLRACEAVASKRKRLYRHEGTGAYLSNFLAVPGSDVYNAYRRGDLQYWMFKLRKDL